MHVLEPLYELLSDIVSGSWQYEAKSFQAVNNRSNDQAHPVLCPTSLKHLEIVMQSKLVSASTFSLQEVGGRITILLFTFKQESFKKRTTAYGWNHFIHRIICPHSSVIKSVCF